MSNEELETCDRNALELTKWHKFFKTLKYRNVKQSLNNILDICHIQAKKLTLDQQVNLMLPLIRAIVSARYL